MNYLPDDLIGIEGDAAATFAKIRKGARKLRSWVRKVSGKAKGARVTAPSGRTVSVTDAGQITVEDQPVESVRAQPGVIEWISKNPILVGAGAIVAILLLTKRRG